ncbi:ataxin-7-like protein 1 isoform X1 [Anoplopoma fimbria]|uniref:ataxin-7-like protein 1 isoform X1 n=1 Tax=Anoplopoma fimbria TaxID=229290 RepID=UPI0023EC2BE6|nr:ataxin-7-like protein 1 isoform X1 [Anoplopoma fimbria]XP_054480777.1 ataxin-7-like protein 1 isoform X1 [Anoplopoma fimbria]
MHSKNQKRHGSPAPSRSLLVPMKPKAPAVAPAVAPSPRDTLAFRIPKDYPHSRFSKAPLAVYPPKGARNKTCVSLPVVSLEKMPCLSHADSASHVRLTTTSASPSSLKPSSLTPPASQRSGEKLTNGRGTSGPSTPRSTTSPSSLDRRPSPSRSPLDRRLLSTPSPSTLDRKPSPSPSPSHRSGALPPSLSSSPLEKKQQNGTKTSSRTQRRLSGRVFDPNKHCGVQDPETKRPCTRSLTCKTHSLTHRRAVSGRRMHFDVLLAEHKGRAKVNEGAKEKEKEKEKGDGSQGGKEGISSQSITPQQTSCPNKPHCPNGRPLSTLKLRLANAHIPRVPGSTTCTSGPLPPAPAPNPEPSPHSLGASAGDGGRLSSDEGDAETPEDTDRPAIHYSNSHPQPFGFCVFRSRLMGRGHYVFDRRWDRMRLALQNMVEKHLNAQMWRKVPLAAESLLSLSSSGTSPVASQQAPSPSSVTSPLLSSPSNSLSYPAAFPKSASMPGTFSIRDAPQPVAPVSALGKARNGTLKASRPSKDTEDSAVASQRRKNSSHPSSSSFSPSSLFPTVDTVRRNGSVCHPTLQGSPATAANPARKKGGASGLWSGGEDWLSRADRSQSHNSQNSRELGMTGIPYSPSREPASAPHQPLASPSGPLAYGGGAEGRKRRSPSSYRGKASKLSRPGGLESLFGNGSDTVGILASGPESPRQTKLHH